MCVCVCVCVCFFLGNFIIDFVSFMACQIFAYTMIVPFLHGKILEKLTSLASSL